MTEKLWLVPMGSRIVVENDPRTLEQMLPEDIRKEKLIVAPGRGMHQRSSRGWIRAIGPDVQRLKVGDYIQFSQYAGQEGQAPIGPFYLIIEEREIAAIIDEASLVQKLVDEETAKHAQESAATASLAATRAKLVALTGAGEGVG